MSAPEAAAATAVSMRVLLVTFGLVPVEAVLVALPAEAFFDDQIKR